MKEITALLLLSTSLCVQATMRGGTAIRAGETIENGNIVAMVDGYVIDTGVTGEEVLVAAAAIGIDEINTNGTVTATIDGRITDTGISVENFLWQSGVTNLSQLAAFVGAKDQSDGYAGLDENGKINESTIPSIIIVYTGDDELQ